MNIRVNRLSVTMHGMRAPDARQLATALARDLRATVAKLGPRSVDKLRIGITAGPGATMRELSRHVAEHVRRSIARGG